MSLLTTVLGGGVGTLVKDIVGTFKLSPAAKQEFEREIALREHELALKDRELQAQLAEYQAREIEAAGGNIQAEANSGDPFTSRARPLFLYVCNTILIWNYIVVPIVGRTPLVFPEELFWLFGSVMLGYVGARSWEKVVKDKKP